MAVNFAKAADALRQELELFFATVRQCEDPRPGVARLRTALRRAETTAAAFPEGWGDLDRNQRWGYARLVSVVKVSRYELNKFGDESEKQDFSNQTRKSLDKERAVGQKRPKPLRRKRRNEQESCLRRLQLQPFPA